MAFYDQKENQIKYLGLGPVRHRSLIGRNDLSADLDLATIRNVTFNTAAATTSFGIDAITDQSSFSDIQNGRMIVQSIIHPVVSTASFSVTVAGDHSSVPVNSGFRLYDDDDNGLDVPSLPRTDLVNEQMKNYFKPAFIEVKDLGGYNLDKYVPFLPTEDVSSIFTTLDDKKEPNILDKNPLWLCHLIAAYQGPMDSDLDPTGSNESRLDGETSSFLGREYSAVYVEDCRELFEVGLRGINATQAKVNLQKWITAAASHEMGHQPKSQDVTVDHGELGLMSESLDGVISNNPEASFFMPKTIKRFRTSSQWTK